MPGPAPEQDAGQHNISQTARSFSHAQRGYIKNLWLEPSMENTISDVMEFMFKPQPVREIISANVSEMAVMGMSHQYESYQNTTSPEISLEAYFNAMMWSKDTGIYGQIGPFLIEESRRFLESLLYPGQTPAGVIGSSQPPCILCLPGICTLRVRLRNLNIEFTRLNQQGELVEMKCSLTFKEAAMGRVTMQDVRTNGMFRSWGEI